MFKEGDIIEVKDGAPYTITKSGTKWMVYLVHSEANMIEIGMLPFGDYNAKDMIRLYAPDGTPGNSNRRREAGIRLYNVFANECKISGNNATFKNKLLQGDIWEEKKPLYKARFIKGKDGWASDGPPFLSNSDLPLWGETE